MVKYVIMNAIPMVPFHWNEVEIWSFRLHSDQKRPELRSNWRCPWFLYRTHVIREIIQM